MKLFVILISITIFLFFLPQAVSRYLFKCIVCRKHPQPGTKAFRDKENHFKNRANPYWIDTIDSKIAEIKSFDGLLLKAFYKPGNIGSKNTIILFHGYTGEARQLSPIAQYVSEKYGYNILMPHLRAHGWSEGKYIGFGWFESLDCIQWVDWVKKETAEEQSHILLIGTSMGAASILIAAGSEQFPPQVKALISDCSFTSAKEEIKYRIEKELHFNSPKLLDYLEVITRKKAGYSFTKSSPIDVVKNIQIPVLYVHGQSDNYTPFHMVNELFNATRSPKELFVVKDADHGGSYKLNEKGYQEKIDKIITSFLTDKGGI